MVAELTEREIAAAMKVAARTDFIDGGRGIVSEVAAIFRIGEDCIYGQSRVRRIVDARTVIACVLRQRGWTFDQIGELLNRDHTTILNLERRAWTDRDLAILSRELAS